MAGYADAMTPRVLIPIPHEDFDTTEVVVPWTALSEAGFEVVFATPGGRPASCDPRLLTGVIFGQLGAKPDNVARYRELERCPAFLGPLPYAALNAADFTALVLPGGHAPGMREYLESATLQAVVRDFFAQGRPVGAICHGPLVLARTLDAQGNSVARGRTLTCLPKWMELLAWGITAWKLGRYYRTYDVTVQDEVTAALGPDGRFVRGPLSNDYSRPFVVRDGDLVTARWPGDAQAFSEAMVEVIRAGR